MTRKKTKIDATADEFYERPSLTIKTVSIFYWHVSKTEIYRPKEIKNLTMAIRDKGKTHAKHHKWWSVTFFHNEVLSITGEARPDRDLVDKYLEEFRHDLVQVYRVRTGKFKISRLRKRYNDNDLGEQIPWLVSFPWTDDGYIAKDTTGMAALEPGDVKAICRKFKIADPRFFTEEQIEFIRKRKKAHDKAYEDWVVPSATDIEHLKKITGRHPYGSIKFPPDMEV